MLGYAGNPDPPVSELDEEEDVEPFEAKRVDREKVRGHDALGLSPKKLPPGGTISTRSRIKTMVLHDRSDRARSQSHTELDQLSLDTAVAPARILPGQANHERDRFIVD
jgi:hypothetical protein